MRSAVEELDAGQATVGVNRLGGEAERLGIRVVPEQRRDGRGLFALEREGRVVDADAAPPPLCLDPAEGSVRTRPLNAEPGGVRHLVEAVGEGLGADVDGLEQDGVPGVRGAPRDGARSGTRALTDPPVSLVTERSLCRGVAGRCRGLASESWN